MTKKQSPGLLTTQKAADQLGVSIRTIQLWCDAGLLPYLRTLGGHRRFRREHLMHVVEAGPGVLSSYADLAQLVTDMAALLQRVVPCIDYIPRFDYSSEELAILAHDAEQMLTRAQAALPASPRSAAWEG